MPTSPLNASSTLTRAATTVAAAVLLGLAIGGGWVVSQVRMAPSAVPAEMSVSSASGKARRSLSAGTHQTLQRASSGPGWNELTSVQREVLAPLKERWVTMGELTKRRWISLADGFDQLPPEDQEKLQQRMHTWSSLSVQQRNQARLNFFTSRQLSPEDLQAKWDAYQALSSEEKRRLAAKAAPKTRGAATALRPQSKRKLATIPAASTTPQTVANPPKILLPPPQPPVRQQPAPAAPGIPPVAPPPVQTAPVVVPQAAPVISLPPLGDNAPVEQVTDRDASVSHSHPDFPPIHSPQ